jgi:drug/metabolite transporter (DMT)-like permease
VDAATPGRDGAPAGPEAASDRVLVHEIEEAAWETRRPLLPELALVGATVAFGATFKIVQDALEEMTPVGFILLRFVVGTLVLLPIAWRVGWRRRDVHAPGETPRSFAVAGLLLGAVAFGGYWLQNLGLQRTTTSSSAFITGLFVVFTPMVETVARRRAPTRAVLAAVATAAVGLFLLTGARFSLGAGELYTLGCAACFGAWIYLGGIYVNRFDAVALTTVQMGAIALFAAPVVAASGLGRVDGQALFAVLFTGIVCSGVAFTLQLWGQRRIEPTRAAVILLFEPVVAGFVGFSVGERLGVKGYLGAAVILASILVAESRSWRERG